MTSSVHSLKDINGHRAIDFAEKENDTEVLNFLCDHVEKMKALAHKVHYIQ